MVQNFFLNRYRRLLGDEEYEKILKVTLPVYIRINSLKIQPEKLVKRLEAVGVFLKKVPFLDYGYEVVEAKFSPGSSAEYLLGYYYIQEAASQCSVQVLTPQPGETVLDMASAPGGKTTQIAQYMQNLGTIIALDTNSRRLNAVKNNLERMGVENCIVFRKDARFAFDLGMQFDKVLLDAPCSGNFIHDPTWFTNRSIEGINERVRLQKELLKAAWKVLKPGGTLVYSTCSLEPEENEMNIHWFLQKFKDCEMLDIPVPGSHGLTNPFGKSLNPEVQKSRRLWPHQFITQGFFIAHMHKKI